MPKFGRPPVPSLLTLALLCVFAPALLLACFSTAPPQPATRPASDVATSAIDCAALDELACLDAAQCTLHQGEDRAYFCASAANDCEQGFLQRTGRQEDCAAGCTFTHARCYCAPDVTCVCGGGPPALCTAPENGSRR